MNERIVFTNLDGSCGVLIPSGEVSIEKVMEKDVPVDATNVRQITINELPQDRLFRDAWDDTNPEDFIGVNLTKAKAIVHKMRRTDRETKLSPLDKEESYATTLQNRKESILTEKQLILTANAVVQESINTISSEEELRVLIKQELYID